MAANEGRLVLTGCESIAPLVKALSVEDNRTVSATARTALETWCAMDAQSRMALTAAMHYAHGTGRLIDLVTLAAIVIRHSEAMRSPQ